MSETKEAVKNGKLIQKIFIEGIIIAESGLHIGGSNLGIAIGGADATVIRNPLTNQPYIPGSSLKGKMRSLTEKLEGQFGDSVGSQVKNGPSHAVNHYISKVYGITPEKMIGQEQPTGRLIVCDCPMTKESAAKFEKMKTTDMPFTEVKAEVVIDRITSAANPRQIERVPAGAEFKLKLILNVYDGEKAEDWLNHIFKGLALVQNDYLGGKGSRGSGQVKFKIIHITHKKKEHYDGNNVAEALDNIQIPEELK